MDDPEFIDHDATVEEVVEKVRGSEDTLIVRKDEEPVGEIHEQSLLKVMVPEGRLDEEKVIGILGFSFDSRYVPEKASDLMNRHEVSVDPEEGAGEIAFLMDREGLRSVPVEDEGEIVGVVHENRLIEEI